MCTVVLAFDPQQEWEALIAATRDEFRAREWKAPGEWWPQRFPGVVGGHDLRGGGTWLAVDPRRRRAAALLNRIEATSVSDDLAASRGVLPLMAVSRGRDAIEEKDLRRCKPFNLVLVEPGQAWWWRYDGSVLQRHEIGPGLHVVTSADMDDTENPRQARWLPAFGNGARPAPVLSPESTGSWGDWRPLLDDRETPAGDPRALNIRFVPSHPGYGTVSASLLALGRGGVRFDFCAGPPDTGTWRRVF